MMDFVVVSGNSVLLITTTFCGSSSVFNSGGRISRLLRLHLGLRRPWLQVIFYFIVELKKGNFQMIPCILWMQPKSRTRVDTESLQVKDLIVRAITNL
jgi:hypothetical protein